MRNKLREVRCLAQPYGSREKKSGFECWLDSQIGLLSSLFLRNYGSLFLEHTVLVWESTERRWSLLAGPDHEGSSSSGLLSCRQWRTWKAYKHFLLVSPFQVSLPFRKYKQFEKHPQEGRRWPWMRKLEATWRVKLGSIFFSSWGSVLGVDLRSISNLQHWKLAAVLSASFLPPCLPLSFPPALPPLHSFCLLSSLKWRVRLKNR